MKLMEHVRELRSEVVRISRVQVEEVNEVHAALDRVERFLQGESNRTNGANSQSPIVDGQDSGVRLKGVKATGKGELVLERWNKKKGKVSLADLVRKFAEEVTCGTYFRRENVERWLAEAHPLVSAKHISAQLGNLATRGELLAKGHGRNRQYIWNPKGQKGKPDAGETLRGQIASGCAEAKAEKTGEQARGLRDGTRDACATAGKTSTVQREKGKHGKPLQPESLVEAIKGMVEPGWDNFSEYDMDGRLMQSFPSLYFRETARDPKAVEVALTRLQEEGFLKVTNPMRKVGEEIFYNRNF